MKKKLLKTSLLILLNVFLLSQLYATVHTVDNKPNSGAEYSDLQTAIDEASAGDTLYIAGSPDSYGYVTLTKKLALIGAGYKVDNQWEMTTRLSQITLREENDEFNNFVGDASGSYFSGLAIGTSSNGLSIRLQVVKNVTFDRCQLAKVNAYGGTSVLIKNCIMTSVQGYETGYTLSVTNSIITSSISVNHPTSSVSFSHCLFITSNISGMNYATVSNSIFYNTSTAGAEFSTFTNNISYSPNPEIYLELLYDTNEGSGNLIGVNPLFGHIDGHDFSYTDDFRLQDNSSGKDAASDGTDIGIYGGSYPFPIGGEGEYLMAAPPRIPQIYEMNIQNITLPQDGTLNVHLKARKQD